MVNFLIAVRIYYGFVQFYMWKMFRNFPPIFIRDLANIRKKIEYYTLYDPRVKIKLPLALKEVGGKYKVLPTDYETPGVLDIFGDHIVIFNSIDIGRFGDDVTIYVMINHELAESFRIWFKFMWNMCEPRNSKMN